MKSARASVTKSATATTSRRETAFSDTEMSNSEASISVRKQASAQSAVESQPEEDKEMEEFMRKVPHSFLIYPGLVGKIYDNSEAIL